ncbi:porphobilinogen synthase domain protein [Leptospira interrogans serovar Grippotyphosa str. LT2186]|uniref:Porphobilinogen synthase domain protein n=1 Tax=Leptospira interrogans serovar Grippotyphosa str. LT2186 TaxID=1001599 RepID=M3GXU1_LEPIR|nr:porphobilinogen synthase domain protein [Leptospira interrogans serovar Grippotyphosa str. LT2186]
METKQRRIRLNAGLRNLASSESLNSKRTNTAYFYRGGFKRKRKNGFSSWGF